MAEPTPESERRTQLLENMRFYGNLRFHQLTLLMAVLTLVGAGIAQYPDLHLTTALSLRSALAGLAMLFTAVIWIMEVRSSMHFRAHRRVVTSDWWPHHESKLFAWLNATNSVLVFLGLIYFFWLYCAWEWNQRSWKFAGPFSVVGVLLVAFSVVEYWGDRWLASDGD
jgi:hypothetical protein